jgi:uncharacterized protein
MDITPLIKENHQVIQSFGKGIYRVAGQLYDGPIFVLPEKTLNWDFHKQAKELVKDDFTVLEKELVNIDVLFLGCGSVPCRVDMQLYSYFKGFDCVLESMDSMAACRTFNVLLAEGRNVAAALIPIE